MNDKAHSNEISRQTLIQAQAGSETALADVYNHYFERVYRFIFYRVTHKETAEDLTEEVFVKLFRNLRNLEKHEAFEGWLFQIARNRVIDYYRSKKSVVPLEEVENTLEYETNIVDVVNLQTEQTVFIKVLKDLSPEQQQVIKLKFLEDLDNATIAEIIGKTEGAIRVIQHRAITRLKELIDKLTENNL
ncbi:MAG TPA: sigma-70 family RNA polymerase sigma factor [Patescibacteria group bacterium]|jgi:RNA polymerase sigma-70 factor (ECF subfamily)|nr:sigma-70 family RNA polymerase sigma factor [Patescibacteria group bacterium]